MAFTIDKKLCARLKATGKFKPIMCENCRNRKSCKERKTNIQNEKNKK